MKIKQVEYKKLFNLGNYEHEEIGITAEPEIIRGVLEKQDALLPDLINKIENIHRATHILQRIKDRIDTIYTNREDLYYGMDLPYDSVTYSEEEIQRAERRIIECKKSMEETEDKEIKKEYKEQIGLLKEEIPLIEEKLLMLQKQGTRLLEVYDKLKADFLNGDYSSINKE